MVNRLRQITAEDAIAKRWAVYDKSNPSDVEAHGDFYQEDICIITLDGEEVVGCSEWMRAERAVFEYIVKIHNDMLGEANE